MIQSEIKFNIDLDDKRIPEKIYWNASEKDDENFSETKAISLSVWDPLQKNTLRIDLWTKDMPVDEMKRFFIDTLGGIGQTLLSSTGDEFMAQEIEALCEKFVEHVRRENNKSGQN